MPADPWTLGLAQLVLASMSSGVVLMLVGLFGLWKYAKLVPPSIVVAFTVGIAGILL